MLVGWMNWEVGIDIYTVCIKQITNEKLPYSSGKSSGCSHGGSLGVAPGR